MWLVVFVEIITIIHPLILSPYTFKLWKPFSTAVRQKETFKNDVKIDLVSQNIDLVSQNNEKHSQNMDLSENNEC